MGEERIEMVPTEELDVEEEVILDEITENTTLRNESRKKVSSKDWRSILCKSILILVAVIVFLAILIRSWSDYGTYITKHVFPPVIHSISTQCPDNSTVGGYQQNFFNSPTSCSWEFQGRATNYTDDDLSALICSVDKPYYNWFLQTTSRKDIMNITWDKQLILNYSGIKQSCVELVIWAI